MSSQASTQRHLIDSVTAIYVVGPSSTGKTTLCNALAKQLGLRDEVYVTEVARTVMREQGFSRADVHKLEMQQAVVDAHVARDTQARSAALFNTSKLAAPRSTLILCDRSAIDALVYAKLTSANDQALLASASFQTALASYRAPHATFVLLRPIADWMHDDGIRSIAEDRERCFEVFQATLDELGIKYFEIGDSCRMLEERVAFVRRCAWV
ncbi:hypothetical protein PENSPDRAFT_652298 [Peniophora sp. CONT]|nr:hypothetical protein PENSPDRAFT_652298 [Peniophora sp. CONT]